MGRAREQVEPGPMGRSRVGEHVGYHGCVDCHQDDEDARQPQHGHATGETAVRPRISQQRQHHERRELHAGEHELMDLPACPEAPAHRARQQHQEGCQPPATQGRTSWQRRLRCRGSYGRRLGHDDRSMGRTLRFP